MKTLKGLILGLLLLLVGLAKGQLSTAFVHSAEASNIVLSRSRIDTNILNNDQGLQFMVTQNINPGGGSGIVNDKKLGLRYMSSRWHIFHQDLTSFTPGTHYNVFVPGADTDTWNHTTTAGNTQGNYTIIDDTRLNNKPNQVFFVFDNFLTNYNTFINGVYYMPNSGRWCIFNQEGNNQPMPAGLDFNIIVPEANTSYAKIQHQATVTNTLANTTTIDHPDLNDNPNAIILLTQVWNPGGTLNGVYNNHNVGVRYSATAKRWRIINLDNAAMPVGAGFNLMIFKNQGLNVAENALSEDQFSLSPNPITKGESVKVNLGELISGETELKVFDFNGRKLLEKSIYKTALTETLEVQLGELAAGTYILRLESQGKLGVQRLLIQ